MSDAIAALRVRIRLERPVSATDDLGGRASAWEHVGEAWAALEAVSANLGPAHDGIRSLSRFRVRVRRGAVAAEAGWRVLWKDRALEVEGVLDDGGPFIDLLCVEERP